MRKTHLAIIGVFLVSLLGGCGGGSSNSNTPPAQKAVQFTSPTSAPTIDAGQSVTFKVSTADGKGVTWSLQAAQGKPLGTLTNESASSATYNAPSNISTKAQVAVLATSVGDNTQTATLSVIINTPLTITKTLSTFNTCQPCPAGGPTTSGCVPLGSASGTVGANYQTQVREVTAIGGTAPYTWKLVGQPPNGLALAISGDTTSAGLTGKPVSTGCSQFSIQATDATGATYVSPAPDPNANPQLTNACCIVAIQPAFLTIQTPNLPAPLTNIPYPPTAVAVSGGLAPYVWCASGPPCLTGAPPQGLALQPLAQNSTAAMISGTPTGPNSGNSQTPYTSQVQVYDSQTPYPASGGIGITMWQEDPTPAACAASPNNNNNVNLAGTYGFLMRGFDAQGPVVMAGSFTADGTGNVTGGVEDVMRTSGSQSLSITPGGSFYAIVPQIVFTGPATFVFVGTGCVTLANSGGSSTTFAFSAGGCSTSAQAGEGNCVPDSQGVPGVYTDGHIIEFDDNTGSGTRATGIVRLQDSTAFATGLSGSYAFGLTGRDSANGRYASAGAFTASSGKFSAVAADINDAGTLQPALTGGSGSYTADPTNGPTFGRWTGNFAVGNVSPNLVIYVVSSKEVLLASTGSASPTNPFEGGEAIARSGPYNVAAIQNSHMFHIGGLATTGPDVSVGILKLDGFGTMSGTQYEDQAGTLSTTSLSASYAVDSSTGRLTFAGQVINGQNLGNHPLVGYVIPPPGNLVRQKCIQLASCVTGFVVSTDSTAQSGALEFQTPTISPPPPFSNLYVAGFYSYGTDESLDADTATLAGTSEANPFPNSLAPWQYAGIQNVSYANSSYCLEPNCALLVPNEPLAAQAAYSINKDGSGTVGGESIGVTNGNVIFYIDESPLNLHPSVMIVEQ